MSVRCSGHEVLQRDPISQVEQDDVEPVGAVCGVRETGQLRVDATPQVRKTVVHSAQVRVESSTGMLDRLGSTLPKPCSYAAVHAHGLTVTKATSDRLRLNVGDLSQQRPPCQLGLIGGSVNGMARIAYDNVDAAAFAATRHLTDAGLAAWQEAITRYLDPPGMRVLDYSSSVISCRGVCAAGGGGAARSIDHRSNLVHRGQTTRSQLPRSAR